MNGVRGLIFEIERFAIHDGPGIRTVVFLKGCNLDCVWCANPESRSPYPEIGHKKEICLHCLRCIDACPEGNLWEHETKILISDKKICRECSLCIEACPQNALVKFGEFLTVDALMKVILRDLDFYQESKGGVTFSGGEPLLQIDFLEAILEECKSRNIHTSIETAGCVDYECFERINDYVDLYLYDIKNLDPQLHEEYTGSPNDIILRNLKELDKNAKESIVRVPLIPGFSDTIRHTKDLFDFCSKLTNLVSIHFLPYHELGKPKYQWTGRSYNSPFPKHTKRSLEIKVKEIDSIAEDYDIPFNIGGLE